MWPFSTICDLKRELAQAETANDQVKRWYGDMRRERDSFKLEKSHLSADLERQVALVGEARRLNVALSEERDNVRRLFDASETVRRQLAAERDEAVLRARRMVERVDEMSMFRQNDAKAIGELRHALQGALVRDPKTGRMTKWVDPSAKAEMPPLVSKTPEMFA